MNVIKCPKCGNVQSLQTANKFTNQTYDANCLACGEFFFGPLIFVPLEPSELDGKVTL